ncbi:MAG TPA: hypothetical protein VGO47_08730 [Chlamydiales bacterium]|nr:hypothetical protein [Chlamydiales bacterium]
MHRPDVIERVDENAPLDLTSPPPPPPRKRPRSRLPLAEVQQEIICLSSDSEDEGTVKRIKIEPLPSLDVEILGDSGELIQISRQLRARLIDINCAPRCWPMQRGPTPVAFRLDLSTQDREWTDGQGKEIGMLLAIRQGVCDSFTVNLPVLRNCGPLGPG